MSGSIPISKSEIEACQEAVQNFRVHELHQLCNKFNYPKFGKKQELVNRALTILTNPKFQVAAVQKVREIQATISVREANQPYPNVSGSPGGSVSSPAIQPLNAINTMNPNLNQGQGMNMNHNPNQAGMNFNPNQQAQRMPFNPNPNQPINQIQPNFPSVQHNHNPWGAQPGVNPLAQMMNAYNAAMYYQHQQHGQHPQQAHPQHFQHPTHHHQQHMPHLNQQQQHVVPMQHSAGGGVRNMRTVELPFYDQIKVIIPLTELPSYPVPTRAGEGRFYCTFGVPPEDIGKLNYSDDQKLPRFELQLRMFLAEGAEEQQDAFPPGSTVKLDDHIVNLPPVIPTNKPNAEQKRYPRPVNITPYCRPPRGRDRPHRLHFEWNGDKRPWAFTVTLVKRLNSDILLERMRNNPSATRPFQQTKDMIIRRMKGDEDDVQMDTLKISLIDPLARTRIKIPSRASDCTHLQSFDLNSYLMMNEKRPGWKCPVCDKNAIYSKLIIDEYFEQMLNSVGNSVEEVELLRDGTWRVPTAADMVSLDSEDEDGGGEMLDDSDEIMIVEKPTAKEKKKPSVDQQPAAAAGQSTKGGESGQQKSAKEKEPPKQPQQQPSGSARPSAPPPKDNDVEIICLSSDEEEEDEDAQIVSAIAASTMATPSARGTPASSQSGATPAVPNTAPIQSQAGGNRPTAPPPVTAAAAQPQMNGHVQAPPPVAVAAAIPPLLQTNNHGGHQQQQPPVFCPIMDELAKTQVAQQLALFLQSVYSKNNSFPPHQQNHQPMTPLSNCSTATSSPKP